MTEQVVLRIRASEPNRTFIGASFCIGDRVLRDFCEAGPAERTLEINDIRKDVQQGGDPTQDAPGIGLRRTHRAALSNCLAAIAAGQCQVYPKS